MPTVDELLNASNEVTTCTVNPDTREIIVPEKYKVLGVFSDEKVTKIPFTCPKVVGNNVDLTEYNLYINYENAIGKSNAYLIDDIVVSGENITFSWLLSRNVTVSPGVVKYSFCAKKLDGDTISNEWNTTIANGLVIQGLEATREIIEENPDIIETLLSKAHSHDNKSVLDKFAESEDGKPTYNGELIGGGGASDFIINMTVTTTDGETFTVTSCDATREQINAAVAADKRVVLRVAVGDIHYELPMVYSYQGYVYLFTAFILTSLTYAVIEPVGENENEWSFVTTKIEADAITYSNSSLSNVSDVKGALNELVSDSHTHLNKTALDKFSETDGKPTYNGETIGVGDITAEDVAYTYPNTDWTDVKQGLDGIIASVEVVGMQIDELAQTAHTHDNKSVLDKLSVANSKLQYNGSDVGLKGDTPVKGVDYWTAADIAEIKSYVDNAILGGEW